MKRLIFLFFLSITSVKTFGNPLLLLESRISYVFRDIMRAYREDLIMTPINRVAGYSPRSYFQESCTKGDLLINCSEIDERFFNHYWTIVEQVENAQATVGKTDAWVKKEVSEILAESRGILLEIEENLDCR